MLGCGEAGYQDAGMGQARMQKCWDGGIWGYGMQDIWGCGLGGVQRVPGVQGDGDTWGWRCTGCEDTGMQGHSCRPVQFHLEPHTYSAAPSTPGKRVMVKWAML